MVARVLHYMPDGCADEREIEGEATQGSPKGFKRSRLNSAGEGVPVPVKAEKIKTLFEPLIRDTDGCASTFPVPSKSCSVLPAMSRAQSFAYNCTIFLHMTMSNSVQVLILI
jgi:hypothetical protein